MDRYEGLIDAVSHGKIDELKEILGDDADLSDKRFSGIVDHAIFVEAEPELLEMLLKAGADVNSKDKFGQTPLVSLAMSSRWNPSNAELLIKYGADVNSQDNNGRTALLFAAADGRRDLVRLLLEAKADHNVINDDLETPLMLAAKKCDECTKLLIEHGAEIDRKGKHGVTALMLAIKKWNFEVVQRLVDSGSDLKIADDDGNTALLVGASVAFKDGIQYLHEHGANVLVKNHNGDNALVLCAAYEFEAEKAAQYLIEAGVDVNEPNHDGVNALMAAAAADDRFGTVDCLINAGAKVDMQDKHGNSALMKACEKGAYRSAQFLIDAKADLNLKNADGDTALVVAADFFHVLRDKADRIIKGLIRHGADLNWQDVNGDTLLLKELHERFSMTVINALISQKGDINLQNNKGDTALHWAARKGLNTQIKKMLKCHANLNIKNAHGDTPLMCAMSEDKEDSIGLLLETSQDVDFVNAYGNSPLIWAIKRGVKEELVLKIAEMTANLMLSDKVGKTALDLAREPMNPFTRRAPKPFLNEDDRGYPQVVAFIESNLLENTIKESPDDDQGLEF